MKKVLVAIVGVSVVIALASFTLVGGDSDQIEFFTSDVTRGPSKTLSRRLVALRRC